MNAEAERIRNLLKSTYDGHPWHGSSLKSILSNITPQQANARVLSECHTIWELVLHITAWRNFAWNKLTGNSSFDINSPEQDWPLVNHIDTNSWLAAQQNLEQSQQSLVQELKSINDEKLYEVVSGRNYSFYVLLHGIIQHDLYHAGQISMLKKQLHITHGR
jgi:uncharacterized damage-inducible protein DinB